MIFIFFVDIGFVFIMFVFGLYVLMCDPYLWCALCIGVLRVVFVGIVVVVFGYAFVYVFGIGYIGLYLVLMASSSVALILLIIDSLRLGGELVLQLLF